MTCCGSSAANPQPYVQSLDPVYGLILYDGRLKKKVNKDKHQELNI